MIITTCTKHILRSWFRLSPRAFPWATACQPRMGRPSSTASGSWEQPPAYHHTPKFYVPPINSASMIETCIVSAFTNNYSFFCTNQTNGKTLDIPVSRKFTERSKNDSSYSFFWFQFVSQKPETEANFSFFWFSILHKMFEKRVVFLDLVLLQRSRIGNNQSRYSFFCFSKIQPKTKNAKTVWFSVFLY